MADGLRVLVVDDEIPLTAVISSYLVREGFDVALAHTGQDAVDVARSHRPDLIVLDLMLPGFDGIEACRLIRQFSDAYIIMLTARDEEVDKVLGLTMGADDYLVKPFSPRELIARVRAMLRRPRSSIPLSATQAPMSIVGLTVDVQARSTLVDGDEVVLTRTEFDLLAAMMARPHAVLTRRQLIEAVWGPGWVGDEHVVDVHIGHLRTKLQDDASDPRFIRTVRAVGYGLVIQT
ncbi:MAG: response regulator transcription factor [Actinomycetota bacterium]|nr:response regulator transcription factor [Candidatus Nanopelagicales bacterium]MDP2286946.1 response regulator transcription factor [Actinomycetota bacterium]